jgi:hypothetical protein
VRLITAPPPVTSPSQGWPSMLPGNATLSSRHTCAWSYAHSAGCSPACHLVRAQGESHVQGETHCSHPALLKAAPPPSPTAPATGQGLS